MLSGTRKLRILIQNAMDAIHNAVFDASYRFS